MRKLVLKMSITLDGFVGGPNGEIDWIFKSMSEDSAETGENVDLEIASQVVVPTEVQHFRRRETAGGAYRGGSLHGTEQSYRPGGAARIFNKLRAPA